MKIRVQNWVILALSLMSQSLTGKHNWSVLYVPIVICRDIFVFSFVSMTCEQSKNQFPLRRIIVFNGNNPNYEFIEIKRFKNFIF